MQQVRKAGRGLAAEGNAFGKANVYAADDLGLSCYSDPPNVEVSVREFEEFSRDRLKVLHTFDRLCGYDTRLESIPDLAPRVKKELMEARLSLAYPTASAADAFAGAKAEFVRRDAISHFALRLAFCKTRDAREWYSRQEQRLFVLRLDALSTEAKEAYLAASGVRCKKLDAASAPVSLRELQLTTAGAKIWAPSGDGVKSSPEWEKNFYEMPFYEVSPHLIAARKVVVRQGMAYVPSSALKLILAKQFKEKLSAGLDVAFQGLSTALADPRVGGFLRSLQDYGMQLLVSTKSSTEDAGEKLTLDNFDELMVRSFPPCMRRLVDKQREQKKHLKHAGRLQLRPFLKECGFTIDESFKWWKQELCRDPEIDAASYEKNYIYDVEHAYGKKGHLQGQNTFGCPKIIGFPAESTGQVHGCPFKSLDMPALKQQLHTWHVPQATMVEVEKLVSHGHHYQYACIEYFKSTHSGHGGDGVGNSPSDFFRESCRHHAKKQEEGSANGSPTKGEPAR